MTNQEVLSLFNNCIFPEYFGEDNVRDIMQTICSSQMHWEYGATKAVIILNEEDFVIKIPFNAYLDEEDEWVFFQGGVTVAESWNQDGDYCEREVTISDKSIEYDLSECFAISERIGFIGKTPIYKQERAVTIDEFYNLDESWDKRKSIITEEDDFKTRSKCDELNIRCFDSLWLRDFINFYGEEILKKFSEFLEDNAINDLHSGNIGYIGNRPVLIDYSGYYEGR